MKITSEHLELIIKIIEKGSFSSAARSLNRVPSAVSMAIAHIEAETNLTLFERSSSGLRPTEAALAIEPYARIVLSKMDQINNRIIEIGGGINTSLKIGVAADVDISAIMTGVTQLANKYPLLEINVIHKPHQEIKEMMHRGEIEMSVSFTEFEYDRDENFSLLSNDKLVVVVSAAYFQKNKKELKNLNLLSGLRQIVVASSRLPVPDKRVVLAESVWFADSLPIALKLIEEGNGWGNLSYSAVAPYLLAEKLMMPSFENSVNGLNIPIHATWLKKNTLSKAASELLKLISKASVSAN